MFVSVALQSIPIIYAMICCFVATMTLYSFPSRREEIYHGLMLVIIGSFLTLLSSCTLVCAALSRGRQMSIVENQKIRAMSVNHHYNADFENDNDGNSNNNNNTTRSRAASENLINGNVAYYIPLHQQQQQHSQQMAPPYTLHAVFHPRPTTQPQQHLQRYTAPTTLATTTTTTTTTTLATTAVDDTERLLPPPPPYTE